MTAAALPELYGEHLESLPDPVIASMQVRDAWRRRLTEQSAGLEFVLADLSRWAPGSTVRVAFLDGDSALHRDVAHATRQITDACNLTLDFGEDEAAGTFRRWTTQDTEYAAEIRVSFDQGGFWSLVGTDSTDPTIGPPNQGIGGRPNQRSLNLGGFTTNRPATWQGVVRHEFLHAVAFHHEHQNLRGPCEQEFRWDDDPGYVPTQDDRGVFVPDGAGRRPGIYTYLGGAFNWWPRAKVDFNLRTVESPELLVGPFDPASIMLYAFAGFFYRSTPSPCAPTGNGIDLSAGDQRGLTVLYPGGNAGDELVAERGKRAERVRTELGVGLEAAGTGTESPHYTRLVELLDALSTGA